MVYLESYQRIRSVDHRRRTQAQLGVFDLAKAQQASRDNLKALAAQGLLDPNNPKQWAAANVAAAKSLEQLSDQAAVAGSNFEQLKRYQLDATNTRTLFDGFSTRSLDTFADGLTSIVTGTKSVKDAFSDMAKSILADLAKIAIKQAIVGPIAGALQGIGGGLLGGGGGVMSSGLGAGTGGLSFPMFASGTNSAPGGLAMINEGGRGEIVDLPRGARVIPHDVSMAMARARGGTTISMGDTQIVVNGNADDYALNQIRAELATHRKAIAAGAKSSVSSQRFAQTGVG
ncbi:phage tail tape measure C-terminal domain-containing protein [Bradyrhizobium sp. Pa8]|uniref:phage tail tape measure C-terminal domain-containing protein n=1 Tax=Bradyrhizobium sp. Pa8 TaxID=3386552 RepID=UPI00403F9BF8